MTCSACRHTVCITYGCTKQLDSMYNNSHSRRHDGPTDLPSFSLTNATPVEMAGSQHGSVRRLRTGVHTTYTNQGAAGWVWRRTMNKTRKPIKAYTCEACGCNAGPSGVRCDECLLETYTPLLGSTAWCDVAVTRTGDYPGETMLQTIVREYTTLNTGEGVV